MTRPMFSAHVKTSDESVLLRAKLSSIPLLVDFLHLVVVALFVAISLAVPVLLIFTLTWLLLVAIGFVRTSVAIFTTEIYVTNRRLMARTGLLAKRQIELLLSKLESVEVHQPFWGRVFDYGTLAVRGTGSSTVPFRFIKSPNRVRHACASAAEQQHQRMGAANSFAPAVQDSPPRETAMPVFEVVVVDRNTGTERVVDVKAVTVDAARDLVVSTGEIVGRVRLKSIG